MGSAAVSATDAGMVDYADVQGIVRFAYKHLTDASYLLLTIKQARAARAWLKSAPIATSEETTPPPASALQVAFTAAGLRALGVANTVIDGFSPEFASGMAGTEDRSRRLGDVGANAPANWVWGAPQREAHVLVALFAAPGTLGVFKDAVTTGTWDEAFDVTACLDTSDLGGVEQFGFTDGISQPSIDWQRRRNLRGDKVRYGNIVALGEFLLGYPNEYACYTERPLLPTGGINDLLPLAEDQPHARDVGRNGTYLVLRDLRQDVRGFWQFVNSRAQSVGLESAALAAAFVGRKATGDPLVPVGQTSIEGIDTTQQAVLQNRFTYAEDPEGVRCPLGAHVRRANPRNADFPTVPRGPIDLLRQMLGFRKAAFYDDLLSSTRFHRILRRGREYGPALSPADAQAPAPPDDPPRGLRFVCLGANIVRQFEFLQNAWIMNDKFDGLTGESDPLLGNRERSSRGLATNSFTIDREDGARTSVGDLPRFVTVTGGGYFFLPGLRSLRYVAQAGAEELE
jgi:deferrochelatase/peroxidase EfeB